MLTSEMVQEIEALTTSLVQSEILVYRDNDLYLTERAFAALTLLLGVLEEGCQVMGGLGLPKRQKKALSRTLELTYNLWESLWRLAHDAPQQTS